MSVENKINKYLTDVNESTFTDLTAKDKQKLLRNLNDLFIDDVADLVGQEIKRSISNVDEPLNDYILDTYNHGIAVLINFLKKEL